MSKSPITVFLEWSWQKKTDDNVKSLHGHSYRLISVILSHSLLLTLFSMDSLILLTSQVKVKPYIALARASLA